MSRSIKQSLTPEATRTLVQAFVSSRLDSFVACCPGALCCGCPARAPGSATVISVVKQGVVSVGRAGEVRPSSRRAIDGACAEVCFCANIITPEYTRTHQEMR